MPKKPHPADLANAAIIAAAIRFDIALFLGTGRFATATAETLDQARIEAARLASENPNGRRPLIYGVTADGRSGLVTDAFFNQTKTETTTMQKTTSTTAKKTNGLLASTAIKQIAKAEKPAAKKSKAAKSAKAKPAKSAKPAKAAAKKLGMRAQIEADAMAGKLPSPPDFSAETHARFRPKLAELVKLAKAGNVAGLKKFDIKPISSSPKAMDRYRNLCVMALTAKK